MEKEHIFQHIEKERAYNLGMALHRHRHTLSLRWQTRPVQPTNRLSMVWCCELCTRQEVSCCIHIAWLIGILRLAALSYFQNKLDLTLSVPLAMRRDTSS